MIHSFILFCNKMKLPERQRPIEYAKKELCLMSFHVWKPVIAD